MKKILFSIFAFIIFNHQALSIDQVSDFGKLYPTHVSDVLYPTTTKQLQNIVQQARTTKKKISIAGARFSQGGQSNGYNSINIDLTHFNKLIKINMVEKTARVQSGMNWEQLQNILHPLGLSIRVMQSSNVFSIGGSASVNAHGRDLHYGPIIETIKSCTIIDSNGQVQELSRDKNPELFSLVIGGYGLFGIITEIELKLTDNVSCYKQQEMIDYKKYVEHFNQKIIKSSNINLYYGRFIITPGKNFLKKIISVSYCVDDNNDQQNIAPLKAEGSIARNQFLFNMYRHNRSKTISLLREILEKNCTAPWENGKINSRNQLMRPYIYCLENKDPNSTDLLQEYFIPLSTFTQFTDQLRAWSKFYNIKLLNVTLRFVPKNTESFLSYAQSDMISFVLYFTTPLDTQSIDIIKKYTEHLTQSCLDCQGIFYLPYQRFASSGQMHSAYPMMHEFLKLKNMYDPEEIFSNNWYHTYLRTL